jgi:hypothetical protein
VAIFLPGQTLSAAALQSLGAVGTYTPALTASSANPSLGTGGLAQGWYGLNGQKVDIWFHLSFGTSGVSAGSGVYRISFPPGLTPMVSLPDTLAGTCRLIDNSAGPAEVPAFCLVTQAQGVVLVATGGGYIQGSSPWTWTTQDRLVGHATYLLDP